MHKSQKDTHRISLHEIRKGRYKIFAQEKVDMGLVCTRIKKLDRSLVYTRLKMVDVDIGNSWPHFGGDPSAWISTCLYQSKTY